MKNLFNVKRLSMCVLAAAMWSLPVVVLAQVDDLVHFKVDIQSISTRIAGKTATQTFVVPAFAQDYNGVILSGSATDDYNQGFIRFLEQAGWTQWQPLKYLSGSTNEIFLAGYRSDTYRSGAAFELHFDLPAGAHVEITEIGVFDNRLDDDQLQTSSTVESEPVQQSPAAITPPVLISRARWGAEDFIGTPVPLAPAGYTRMTFHHAACCGAFTFEEGLTQVKGIQDFHQEVRGWSDIGYHFLFDQSGRLYQGRPFLDNRTNLTLPPVLSLGAHVGGANTGNIGVSVLGCYHPAEGAACTDVMSPALRDSLVTLYAYLSEQYGVTTDNLFGHRDQSATSCPGDNNYALLPELRVEIDDLIRTGGEPRPASNFLAENYPNPFYATTTIRYYLENDGIVRLKIYDPLGRLVATLVDTFQEKDRWYAAEFDASLLSDGIYFYRLQVEGFSNVVFDKTGTMVHMYYQTNIR